MLDFPMATARIVLFAGVILSGAACAASSTKSNDADDYGLLFELRLEADQPVATGAITVEQTKNLLREARLRAPADRYGDFAGDGVIERVDDIVVWRPPASGGTLRYRVTIDNQRKSGSYDARVTRRWAIFRGDDVFPAAATRHAAGATSRSRLRFALPERWSVVAPYANRLDGVTFDVRREGRRFDRPIGWMVAGRLGTRRDTIDGIEIAVSGPVNHGIERISMLALLRWTMPVLVQESERRPAHIAIVSANDAMWRGGLSAPNSVFVHAERPLLSENGTSTLLHEMVHVMLPVPTARSQDWIDEGLAEYLTLRTLRDSGTISAERFERALSGFRDRGEDVKSLTTRQASGAITARAVAVFADLDRELLSASNGDNDLFDLARTLGRENAPVDLKRLREIAAELLGGKAANTLAAGRLPM